MRYYQTKWHDMYHSFDLRRAMLMTRTLPLQRNQGRRSSGSSQSGNERTDTIDFITFLADEVGRYTVL